MQLIKLRFFQIKRDLGLWFILIAVTGFYFASLIPAEEKNYVIGINAAFLFILLNHHTNRNDFNFLKHYIHSYRWQIIINYNLLALPLSAGMAFGTSSISPFLLHILVSLTGLLEFTVKGAKLRFISRFVPPAHFEWISGLRRNFFILIVLFALALILSPVKLFGIAALFLLNLTFIGFFHSYEPLMMLNPENKDIKSFLRQKVNFFISVIAITNIPLLVINSLFNTDVIAFDFFFFLSFILLGATAIYIKYANYYPNGEQGFNIDSLILTASVLLPYLLPLSIIIYFNSRKKAIANLTVYLDDQS